MKIILFKWIIPFLIRHEALAKELIMMVLGHYINDSKNGLKKESVTRVKNQWDKKVEEE